MKQSTTGICHPHRTQYARIWTYISLLHSAQKSKRLSTLKNYYIQFFDNITWLLRNRTIKRNPPFWIKLQNTEAPRRHITAYHQTPSQTPHYSSGHCTGHTTQHHMLWYVPCRLLPSHISQNSVIQYLIIYEHNYMCIIFITGLKPTTLTGCILHSTCIILKRTFMSIYFILYHFVLPFHRKFQSIFIWISILWSNLSHLIALYSCNRNVTLKMAGLPAETCTWKYHNESTSVKVSAFCWCLKHISTIKIGWVMCWLDT